MKYIAIKLKAFDYWLWFEIKKVKRENGVFIGKEGWGDGGNLTEININEDLIEGEITSETLQYSS